MQRAPDGLNFTGRTQTMQWNIITLANWQLIAAFVENHLSLPFNYQIPGDSISRQWTTSGYKLGVWDGQNWLGDSVTLTQDFTPPP